MERSMNLKGFAVVLGTILVVFLVLHVFLRSDLHRKSEKENELRLTLSRLEAENNALLEQMDMVGTEDFIVQSAIRDYSYVNRDDIRFEFTNPEALEAYSEAELQILVEEMTD